MSTNFAIRKVEMSHEDDTKFYRMLVVFSTETKFAVLIKRWGKVSHHGQFNIQRYATVGEATAAMREQEKAKLKRGYSTTAFPVVIDSDSYSNFAAGQMLFDEGVSKHMTTDLLLYMSGETSSTGGEIEIVFEGSIDEPVINRDGDKEWASW